MINTNILKQNIIQQTCLILLFCICTSCNKSKTTSFKITKKTETINTTIPVYNFNNLEPFLHTDSNKTYIVNFWAMWCAPCVEELPYIKAYSTKHPEVEVLLVSMDFPKDIETKLKPFLKQKNITNKVVILDDPDANTWINKIDPNWSGAIPFTIIFNNKKRAFYERSFKDETDLETEVNKIINN